MSQPGARGAEQIVSPDSDKNMDELFRVLKDSSLATKSLKQRNLPPSFWQQPQIKPNHSREGSSDGSFGRPSGLTPVHGRSHSSPAQLPNTLSVPTPQVHIKQASMGDFIDDLGPLPPGWEMAKTSDGQAYYINHVTQTTTWMDPRKSLSNSSLSQLTLPASQPTAAPTLSPATSMQLPQPQQPAIPKIPPLPCGWEQAATPDGEVYFINHMDRTTSWFDPRLAGGAPAGKVPSKAALSPHHGQSPPQLPTHTPAHPHSNASLSPAAPQQSAAATTTVSPPQSTASPRGSANESQVRSQLMLLQQERARLLQRQEEIKRQEQMLQELTQGNHPVIPTSQTGGDLPNISALGVDPFLGQGGTLIEAHARQNSGDSGLGGMGNNYSLPRTPEDFLGHVDEMDTHDGVGHKLSNVAGTDFNLNDIPPNMEVGNIGESSNDGTVMDSDDLVPSLQEDISSDLLSEMDVSKMENILTWL